MQQGLIGGTPLDELLGSNAWRGFNAALQKAA
jgi:hypothetical protein